MFKSYLYNYNIYLIKKCIYLFIISLSVIYIFKISKNPQTKVCICTIGKNENKYAREFVEYYKKLGVNKIFVYDNNNIDGEHFETILYDYINEGYVKINNKYRGKTQIQYPIFNHCYKENNHLYDWLIYYDFDEFIHLSNYSSIKNYLGDNRFKKCNVVYLAQIMHTDNDQIYYSNKSLFKRFPNFTLNFTRKIGITKIIVRGNLQNINFTNAHVLINKNQCNSFGNKTKLKYEDLYNDYFFYHHFYFKSTEEYYNKLERGGVTSGKKAFIPKLFDFYFSLNRITKEKIDYIENRSGLILTRFRLKLNE